ncbi:hypothetical protein BJ875DRAFT_257166 [Amylocarpus encephaloides]|uniref:Uncharacterized protein n=1 Tax=Amylocarpus encephaloides TaxID=45428 RepID=A0A9P7Y7L7_9HELO|nr:hypothetical protein BJ875DRAFT_257166 [Amylocarpus encephaloides]
MDARERDGSHLGRPGIKRAWDEDRRTVGKESDWHGALLPPLEARPHRIPPQPRVMGGSPNSYIPFASEFPEPEAKRPRYDHHEHHHGPALGPSSELNGQLLHSRPRHTMHDTNRINHRGLPPEAPPPLRSPRLPPPQTAVGWEAQARDHAPQPIHRDHLPPPQETNDLCWRCGKILTQPEDADLLESSKSIEVVTQAAAVALTQLADTLSSGISSEQRVVSLSPVQREAAEACPKEYPPISQSGLRDTLAWILGRIHHVNGLADKLVQHSPTGAPRNPKSHLLRNGSLSLAHPSDIMKRRLEPEVDHAYGMRNEALDPAMDVKLYGNSRERDSNLEDHATMQTQYTSRYRPAQQLDGPDSRVSIMNPPLVVTGRQLPSPPGRSIPSPTSISFPSPSASTFGSSSQAVNLPPPSSLQQSPMTGYLPPIGTPRPDPAMQAHSAALQHEVSVQKIALSTLQTEHDKLLAAYLRSQTRASTLEKKQNVSDSELISLAEEKSRLQEQIMSLEKDIEDLTKSKEECRQAAVQEGKQYVEIVKKASQLEMMAAEERKTWNKLKKELEDKVEALKVSSGKKDASGSTGANTPNSSVSHDDVGPSIASDAMNSLKIESIAASTDSPTSGATVKQSADVYRVKALEEEVRRLRRRCIEMEKALHAVRDDSRSTEGLIVALGLAGKSILDRATKALDSSGEE